MADARLLIAAGTNCTCCTRSVLAALVVVMDFLALRASVSRRRSSPGAAVCIPAVLVVAGRRIHLLCAAGAGCCLSSLTDFLHFLKLSGHFLELGHASLLPSGVPASYALCMYYPLGT